MTIARRQIHDADVSKYGMECVYVRGWWFRCLPL